MKNSVLVVLLLTSSVAFAVENEAALKDQMHKDCGVLFQAGGPCADVIKGTRNCTRLNMEKAGEKCVNFEKSHQDFFEAGKNDPIIKK